MNNFLVTGAAKGLGLEITKSILKRIDDSVVYGVNRSISDDYELLMQQFPGRVFFKSYDLGNVEDLKKEIFQEFISSKLVLSGFVNNAAYAYDDIVTNLNLSELEKMYRVNVFSPMMLTKLSIRNMLLHRKTGSIVHVSSISVHTGYKGLAMYASTKGALEAFLKNTAREWGELGIRSNTLVAGFMETGMSATLTDEQKDRIYKRTALKKETSKESVADTIAFLLSDQSLSITGQNIHVDSGTI
jgi:3-oxoacyl-[acyl-carrier protein] reductase